MEEDITEWADYFHAFQKADPQLAHIVFKHMLVPVDKRADAASLANLAGALPPPQDPRLDGVCRQMDHNTTRQAQRIALKLRLDDEAATKSVS